jgi:ubiquinone biosynthesis monooxygenase Coq7
MPRKPKPTAPGSTPDIESMIRVDHAGEFGAVRIYEGQLAVLRRRKGAAASVETIAHMAEQEQRHLKAFDTLYASQIAALEDRDPALKERIEDFRADEAAHRDTALAAGAEQAPGYKLLSETIKAGCRIAIKLSERI